MEQDIYRVWKRQILSEHIGTDVKPAATAPEQSLLAEPSAEEAMTFTSQSSLDDALEEILRQAQRLVPYRTAHIMLCEGDHLRMAAWRGYEAFDSAKLMSNLTQPLADFPLDAEVIRSQRSLLISDTRQEPGWRVSEETAWIRSNIMLPISLNDRVLGLLRLDADKPGAFSPDDIATLQPLANITAIALENTRLYEQARQEVAERKRAEEALQSSLERLKVVYNQATHYAQELHAEITGRELVEEEIRRRNRELTLLNRIISASVTEVEPEAVLETACRELALTFDAVHVTATLLDEEKMTAVVVAEYLTEDRPMSLHQTEAVADNPVLQYLLSHKAPLVVNDAPRDSRLASIRDSLCQRGCMSLVVLPLMSKGDLIGSLMIEATEADHFSAEEISLGWSVADQVAGALIRSRLDKERRRLSATIEQTAESIIITDTKGQIVYVNPAFERITGYSRAEAIGQDMVTLLKSDKQDANFYEEMWATLKVEQMWHGRFVSKKKDGALYTEDATISPIRSETGSVVNYVVIKRDVTHELQLEAQYRHAQKMDAIGRLAGGIAHDFNNLLTVINGFAGMLHSQLAPQDPNRELVEIILNSGRRAAELIRQLLAFSRNQVVEPKILNLNTIVADMEKMLGRIIGADIDLKAILAPHLWPIKGDPTQIEQIIINLAVNARDAMPEGGHLIIETANVVLDEMYTANHLGSGSGEYVLLAVSDTGSGIDEEVKAHIFEPFFTTKEAGRGTGLGLATVFGIVEQNGGYIWVYSELEQGTTFKVYLPRTKEAPDPADQVKGQAGNLPAGTETILLVEDDSGLRAMAVRLLRRQGYTVLEAANGKEALQINQEHSAEIHLLLTDMVMPQINGKVLAEQFKSLRPQVKLLFMSGYTDAKIGLSDGLDLNGAFIQKPFSVLELAHKVRSVLDS